jgi:hypothetical protein
VRLQLALEQAAELTTRIKELAKVRYEPLTRLCGVDLLTAGALAGHPWSRSPIQHRCATRGLRRCSPARSFFGRTNTPSPQPRGQPPTELHPLQNRSHPGSSLAAGAGLLRSQDW